MLPEMNANGDLSIWSRAELRAEVERLRGLSNDYEQQYRSAVDARVSALNDRDAAGDAIAALWRRGLELAATCERVRTVVDEYGDDFEPEDGWRLIRDLLAALDPEKGIDDE